MNLWEWLEDRRDEYEDAGDEQRVRLTEYWERAFPYRETDPDHAVAMLREGCLLAEQLGERWWTIALHHWLLDALMHFRRDYRQVIELAVRNAVAVSRPENAAFPGRWGVYRDLVCAYAGVDPEGYAEPIRATLAHLDREIPPGPNPDRYPILGSLRQFHQELGDYDAAEAVVRRAEELTSRDSNRYGATHSLVFHYSGLCWMAYKQADWQKLAEGAELGEEAARMMGHQLELCEFLAWQALLARRGSDELRARRLHSTAAAKLARLQTPPEREYPDATAAFHELGGDLEKALQVRDRELTVIVDRGRLAYECEVHLKRAALLARMGRLHAANLDAARQAAMKLRKPEKALTEIDKLTTSLRENGERK